MKPETSSVWKPFYFSAVLCTIFLVANLVGSSATGKSDVGLIPFICFLPMAFWFVANANRETREYIDALEARIGKLEGNADG